MSVFVAPVEWVMLPETTRELLIPLAWPNALVEGLLCCAAPPLKLTVPEALIPIWLASDLFTPEDVPFLTLRTSFFPVLTVWPSGMSVWSA